MRHAQATAQGSITLDLPMFFNWYKWQLRGLQIPVSASGNNFLHQLLFVVKSLDVFGGILKGDSMRKYQKRTDIPWRNLHEKALLEPQHAAPKKQMPIRLN